MARTKKATEVKQDKGAGKAAPSSLADQLRARLSQGHADGVVPAPEDAGHLDFVSTGSPALDAALGVPGWARGRIHAIQGPEHSGKTSLTYLGAGEFQRITKELVVFINVERRHSASLAQVCKADIDPSKLVILEPDTAEEACALAMEAMGYTFDEKKGWSDRPVEQPAGMVIYDSWGGSPTKGVAMAELARIGSIWWPKLSIAVERSNAIMLTTNHVHYKPGVVYGNPEYATGGEKFKYMQTTRVSVHKSGDVEKNSFGERIGHTMKLKIEKNGLAPPFKEVSLHLNYYGGFDTLKDAFELAAQKGLTFKETPTGNILVLADPTSGEVILRANGQKAFFDELRGDPDAAELFIKLAKDWIPNGSTT